MINEYTTVVSYISAANLNSGFESFDQKVKLNLTYGWQPLGNLSVAPVDDGKYLIACQVMVKYEGE